MNSPETHLEKAGAAQGGLEVVCPVDKVSFVQKRRWQRFCSDKCRNDYHGSMTPEALRRDIDDLRSRLAALEAKSAA